MIRVRFIEAGDDAVVELLQGTAADAQDPDCLQRLNEAPAMLERLAVSGKEVLFRIPKVDDDGLVFLLTGRWLELAPTIRVETDEVYADIFVRIHGDRVLFAQ